MRTCAIALLVVLAGCGGDRSASPASRAASSCPVTAPGGKAPDGFDYGNGALAVALWPDGTLVAGRLPDGSSYAEIRPDGSVWAKLGWWRSVDGGLSIEGERIDAAAPPLRAEVPAGYGPRGFQVSGVTFPTDGCWKVRGSVGDEQLTFVVRVRKRS